MKKEQLELIKNGTGFIAALDQSGGSTPKALALYGVSEDQYSTEEEMYGLIHEMRTRIMTAPAFNSESIIGAILFEQTMNRTVGGLFTPDYLWEGKKRTRGGRAPRRAAVTRAAGRRRLAAHQRRHLRLQQRLRQHLAHRPAGVRPDDRTEAGVRAAGTTRCTTSPPISSGRRWTTTSTPPRPHPRAGGGRLEATLLRGGGPDAARPERHDRPVREPAGSAAGTLGRVQQPRRRWTAPRPRDGCSSGSRRRCGAWPGPRSSSSIRTTARPTWTGTTGASTPRPPRSPLQRLQLTAGGRLDENEKFGTSGPTGRAPSPSPPPTPASAASVGTGFKEPSFFENFDSPFSVGNPDLKPERSFSVEGGVDQDLMGERAAASG